MRRLLACMFFAPLAFAQLDSNSLTVTASRIIYVQPDQVVIRIDVTTNTTATLDQVLAAVQPAGVSASNLVGVRTVTSYDNSSVATALDWSFSETVPFATMKSTFQALSALQKNIVGSNFGANLLFSVARTQTSAQALATQPCATTDLVSDARAQALKFATAAGFGLGPVLALSDEARSAVPTWVSYVAANNSTQPALTFNEISGAITEVLSPSPCALTVKFRLLPGS